ncbi:MAG: hypothetical protein WA240_14635 [Nitrospirota bacterium]
MAGDYLYPFAEYELWKSFIINYIDALKKGELLQWNEYIGGGHPAIYFGHYPISQNTFFYMVFGLSDFTFYFTKFLGLTILLLSFIYACRYLMLSYPIALAGALVYFSVNFVIRVLVAETIGNLLFVYPFLMIFIVKIIDENKIRDILIFSLFYIFWLSGGHIIYVYMHLIMLSLFYLIAIFVFYKSSAFKAVNLKRLIPLYFILFIIPLLAVLYQYYFIYDVVSASNRLKEGLIVSPFEFTVWKQFIASFQSSSYFWVGLFLLAIYTALRLLNIRYSFIKTKEFKIPLWSLLLVIPLLYGVLYSIANTTNKNFGDNVIVNGGFETDTSGLTAYKVATSVVAGGQSGNALQVTTSEDATGYAHIAVPTEIGENYKFTLYFKRGTAANGQIKIGVEIDNTNLYYSGVLSDADWTRYNGSFQASTASTYITLVNLTSVKNQSSFFDSVAVYKLKPSPLADYAPIINSKVFLISFALYFLMNGLSIYRKGALLDASVLSLFTFIVLFIVYISSLSYYFYSPENIIGDVNGYDYDLFRELSNPLQAIFIFCVLFSLRDFQSNKMVKITVIATVVLYLIRSHFTIPMMRFTGIVWYAPRDGSIFSFFYAVLFMFGLKNLLSDISCLFKNRGSLAVQYVSYVMLVLLLAILVRDSFDKFYKGTSHRFIYPNKKEIANSSMEKWILDGREDILLLNKKLLALDKETNHFYRTFIPENSYLYLTGNMQQHKIHEAAIYDSSISREMQDFYDYTIFKKRPLNTKELKYVMPYFLFTKHVHAGLNLKYKEISYGDFFMFSPKDEGYLQNQNIEFLWDIMQVKYLIIGPEFSKVLEGFTNHNDYKLIGNYPKLNFNLYEITKNKSYSKLAVLSLENQQSYDDIIKQLNSKDVGVLREMYSKLVFLDQNNAGFSLLKAQNNGNKRYYEVDSKQKAVLIDFESWNRNWKLKINNENEKLQKAFQIFKGIEIKPGLNRIEMTYNLKYFKGLFLIAVITIFIYAALLGIFYYREKKKRRGDLYGSDK